jgi:hypothetical protein
VVLLAGSVPDCDLSRFPCFSRNLGGFDAGWVEREKMTQTVKIESQILGNLVAFDLL